MPILSRSRRAVLVGVAVVIFSRTPSEAHAVLEDSQPKSGAIIPSGSVVLKLRFNSRIDRARSGLSLFMSPVEAAANPSRHRTSLPIDPDGPPDILTATATLTPGAYVARWQVLAVDGHITRGDIPFTVRGN